MAPDISVCVATYRRPEGLARLLDSLRRQKLPAGVDVEILVVDNDPEGSAVRAARSEGAERWLHEPRRNIACARNRALAEARGEWLASHWRMAEGGHWDGLFGPVLPHLERVVTPWLEPQRFYGRPRHASGTPIGAAEARTSNAFVRRALLAGHRFDPAYGLSGGSDTELFARLLASGARLAFCDEARVVEWIGPERHRLAWLSRRAFRGGFVFTRMALRRDRGRALVRGLPRTLAALAAAAAAIPVLACAGRVPAARAWLRLCVQAGHLWAFAGRDFEEYRNGGDGP